MGISCEKTETPDKIAIKFSRLPVIFIIAIAGLVLLVATNAYFAEFSKLATPFILIVLALFAVSLIELGNALKQAQQAAREGKTVSYSGSKFSFSNPYTVEISKK